MTLDLAVKETLRRCPLLVPHHLSKVDPPLLNRDLRISGGVLRYNQRRCHQLRQFLPALLAAVMFSL